MRRLSLAIFFVIFTSSISLEAQTLFVGTEQQLWLSTGGLLTVHGNLDNSGEITNHGELSVSGNWTMQGEYVAGTGSVIFNGSEPQQIHHKGQSVYRLSIENGGEKSISSNISVSSVLHLDSGIIRPENNQQVMLGPGAEVTGGNLYSFVDGIVVNTGTGYKNFPVGRNDQYLPVELLDVRGSSPVLSVQVTEPHPEPLGLDGLEAVSSQRYWQVNTLSGTYEGSVVRLNIVDEHDFRTLTGLVVAAAPEVSATYVSLGNAEVSGTLDEGSITSKKPTSLSVLVLGLTTEYSEEGEVLVPNAFAPDSPLEEDRTLSIFAVNLVPEDFVFRIFNRWGKLVYETTSLDEAVETGWDGINQETNQPAQFGVYSYYLSGKFSDNEPVVKNGTLTLFR